MSSSADIVEVVRHTIADMEGSLGCPQCRAKELLEGIRDTNSDYCRGQRIACRIVLVYKHECGITKK